MKSFHRLPWRGLCLAGMLFFGPFQGVSAGPVFNEIWDDGLFVPGLSITAFDGATFTAAGGVLTLVGINADSRIVITLPEFATNLFFEQIDHALPVGPKVFMNEFANLLGGGEALMGAETFESVNSKRKTILDSSLHAIGEIVYSDDQYVSQSVTQQGNKVFVTVQVKKALDSSDVGGPMIFSYDAVLPNGPARDFGRLEFLVGDQQLRLGRLAGATGVSVPEPSTIALVGLAIAGLVVASLRAGAASLTGGGVRSSG